MQLARFSSEILEKSTLLTALTATGNSLFFCSVVLLADDPPPPPQPVITALAKTATANFIKDALIVLMPVIILFIFYVFIVSQRIKSSYFLLLYVNGVSCCF